MKYQLIIILLFAFAGSMIAQETNDDYIEIGGEHAKKQKELQTFQRSIDHSGFMFGVDLRYAQIEEENTFVAGAKLAYVMNRSLEIGFAGVGMFSEQKPNAFFKDDWNLYAAYGGLHLAANIMPTKKVHFSIPILLGAGAVGYDEIIREPNQLRRYEDDVDEIFVAQVGGALVFNITHFMQAEIGIHYLHTTDIQLEHAPGLDINGVSGGFGLRFGRF